MAPVWMRCIIADPASDPWNPNAVRASVGTVFSMPLAVCSATEARAFLGDRGITVVAADPDGGRPYHEVDLRGPIAIILGAEAVGLSDEWRAGDVTPGADPDARQRGQPERLGQRRRPLLRGTPPATCDAS